MYVDAIEISSRTCINTLYVFGHRIQFQYALAIETLSAVQCITKNLNCFLKVFALLCKLISQHINIMFSVLFFVYRGPKSKRCSNYKSRGEHCTPRSTVTPGDTRETQRTGRHRCHQTSGNLQCKFTETPRAILFPWWPLTNVPKTPRHVSKFAHRTSRANYDHHHNNKHTQRRWQVCVCVCGCVNI